ncbi:MAG: thiamine phosphate synthase [Acaryochloridaceae cyanobacterium SU_2_1]|nr:thiamine phosphate synthase [Acaryochloridaceae cyanobacterium SU_2_1]
MLSILDLKNSVVNSQNSTLDRILDANLDRAREGLRVIEEWCRFGLDNQSLTSACKQLRQELGGWHSPQLRMARNTPEDPGTALTHPQEQRRADISTVLQVNFSRVQEALRVLEEYGKIENIAMAAAAKQLRYQIYTLESQVLAQDCHQKLAKAALYLVTSPCPNLLAVVEAALEGGLSLVQYREKQAHDHDRLTLARQIGQLCHRYNALFIVNDRLDIAIAAAADGVHLGQQDLPIAVARQLLGPHKIVGRSTTNPQELKRAIDEQADYIGVGPIYKTPTKADKTAVGHDYIRYAADHAPMPWYAIGGIDEHNLANVIASGASRIAVVRAIIDSPTPTQVTQTLLQQLAIKPPTLEKIS